VLTRKLYEMNMLVGLKDNACEMMCNASSAGRKYFELESP